jgi:hypothetical protein
MSDTETAKPEAPAAPAAPPTPAEVLNKIASGLDLKFDRAVPTVQPFENRHDPLTMELNFKTSEGKPVNAHVSVYSREVKSLSPAEVEALVKLRLQNAMNGLRELCLTTKIVIA